MKKGIVQYSLLFIVLVYSLTGMCQAPTLGLMAHYPLDGDGTDLGPYHTFADTFTGGGFHAPLPVNDRFGRPGKAMLFGSGNYMQVPDTAAIHYSSQMVNAYTMAGWIRPVDFATSAPIVSIENATGGVQGEFMAAPDNANNESIFYFDYITGGIFSPGNNVPWDTTAWAHLAITYDNAVVNYYINGTWIGTATANTTTAPTFAQTSTYIGISPFGGYEYSDAAIDDIYLYDRALTGTEINSLFNTTSGIDELSSSNRITVSPNPVNTILNISTAKPSLNAQAMIYDMTGKLLLTTTDVSSNEVNVSCLSSGVYLLYIENNGVPYRTKFVKE